MLTTHFIIIIVFTRWKLREKCDFTAINYKCTGKKDAAMQGHPASCQGVKD
jgi:hypothetical protein